MESNSINDRKEVPAQEEGEYEILDMNEMYNQNQEFQRVDIENGMQFAD